MSYYNTGVRWRRHNTSALSCSAWEDKLFSGNFLAAIRMYTLTSHNKRAEISIAFVFVVAPVLFLGPLPMVELVCKPGKVPGAAHPSEQNR